MMTELQFGPWLPEGADYKNPGLEVCTNAVPSPSGYQPAYELEGLGATVTGTIIGAKSFERSDGTAVVCCATTSDLYVIVGGVETASSLSLSLSATDRVVFEQFDTQVFATTKAGDTWYLTDIESDLSFSAVPNSPPEANAIGRVLDFLVMGDLTDIDASDQPYRVRWSQFNNPAGTWAADIATQTDFQDLDAQQGRITAISGGTFGFVFQRNGITRMQYVGGSSVFSFDLYEKNRGCAASYSVARVGDTAYFLSYDGFFQTDGASVQAISQGKMWQWFQENSNASKLELTTAAIDWRRRCVVWFFMGAGQTTYTGQLWYNWETASWSYVEQAAEFGVLTTVTSGTTLEGLAATYPDLDAMTISLDSEVFAATGRSMGAFSGNELSTFTGAPLEPTFQTGSFQPQVGKRTFVRSLTPLIANDAENTTVNIGTREAMTKSFITSQTATVGARGYAPLNSDGRYYRATIRIPAGQTWSDAYGFQIDYSVSGQY